MSCAIRITLAAAAVAAVAAPTPWRLTREGAQLLLGGKPFAAIGLNVVDLLWVRQGADCCHQRNNTRALEDAAARGFPFVRFAASPYFPGGAEPEPGQWSQSLRDWRDEPERYWRDGMDRIVALARRLGIRLVPDLLWNAFAFADLCSEPLSALFNGSDTCTRRAARDFVTQAALRYASSDEILFWEISNENNALVDGWFANATTACDPLRGTPSHRSDADNFDTAQMIATHAWLAELVRAADPGRLVNSGNSLPRPSAEHWRRTPRTAVAHHHIDSRRDNHSEFVRNLIDTSASMDFASAHAGGGDSSDDRPFGPNMTTSDPTWLLELARATAANHSLPFYLGEFAITVTASDGGLSGASPPPSRSYTFAEAVVDWVIRTACKSGGSVGMAGVLASVWVFEYKPQHSTLSVVPGRDDQLLAKLEEANKILRTCMHSH